MKTATEIYSPGEPPVSPEKLAIAAGNGDKKAIEAWRKTGEALGTGIAALINIFNPEMVLIGGGVSGAGSFILDPAIETTRKRSYRQSWEETTVTFAGLKEKSGLLGAAALAFQHADITISKMKSPKAQ
jgi:glucokinase